MSFIQAAGKARRLYVFTSRRRPCLRWLRQAGRRPRRWSPARNVEDVGLKGFLFNHPFLLAHVFNPIIMRGNKILHSAEQVNHRLNVYD